MNELEFIINMIINNHFYFGQISMNSTSALNDFNQCNSFKISYFKIDKY